MRRIALMVMVVAVAVTMFAMSAGPLLAEPSTNQAKKPCKGVKDKKKKKRCLKRLAALS